MKIKISTTGSEKANNLSQYLPDELKRAGIEFRLNDGIRKADAWFVIEGVQEDDAWCEVPEGSVFFLGAETARPAGFFYSRAGWLDFLSQFDHVFSPQELYWENFTHDFPYLPWMINANHGESIFSSHPRDFEFLKGMSALTKTKSISMVCSSKVFTHEHAMRFRFAEKLKSHFKDRLDWFGNGINELPEKWDGLADYRYSIALENQVSSKLLTEKLLDPLLTFTVPIYSGAPEAKSLFPERAVVPINIRDFISTREVIEEILEREDYEARIPALEEARDFIFSTFNFLTRIALIAVGVDIHRGRSRIQVRNPGYFAAKGRLGNPLFESRRFVGRVFNHIGYRLLG